ncbi:MAG TPA: Clp protease N-terminal domain-containing protein, partial [Gemmataceae bacterium]|nr:Clp protease N-terminal domain-containing protein [Gemmataceae bacterium]
MLPELSPAVERAVAAARDLAGGAEVRPPHLLYGLLAEEEGRAATLLLGAGVDPAAARALLADLAAREPAAPGRGIGPLMNLARDLSAELYVERIVTSDALVLALLREEAELRRALEAIGLDF